MMRRFVICMALMASLSGINFGVADEPEAKPEPKAETKAQLKPELKFADRVIYRTVQSEVDNGPRTYAVWIPKEYAESKQEWPLILFLHGFGERGDDGKGALVHGPLKEAANGRDLPFIIVAPQVPKVPLSKAPIAWKERDADLMKMLEDTKHDYRIDSKRIYLTGVSMGGFGTYCIAALHPGMFAAVAPICGGAPASTASTYVGTPFWIFHGDKDPIVRPQFSTDMYDAMKAAGVDVKLTMYPGVLHDSWTETYANPELYSWFLSHSLK